MKSCFFQSVARVLFNQENNADLDKQQNDEFDKWLFIENDDGVRAVEDHNNCNYKTELTSVSSFASDNDEICNLSPCVVDSKIEKLEGEDEEDYALGVFIQKEVQGSIVRDTETVCLGPTGETFAIKDGLVAYFNDKLISSDYRNGEKPENESILSSPPVVCSGINKKICVISDSMQDSTNNKASVRLPCSAANEEEGDLKRRNKRRRRKENRRRVGDENHNSVSNYIERKSKDKESELSPYTTFNIHSKSDIKYSQAYISPGLASSLASQESGRKPVKDKGENVDAELSLYRLKDDPPEPCFAKVFKGEASTKGVADNLLVDNTSNSGKHNLLVRDTMCLPVEASLRGSSFKLSFKGVESSHQIANKAVDRGKVNVTGSDKERPSETLSSPIKIEIGGHSFSFSPKKGSDVSETFDLDPTSPTVVSTTKADQIKNAKGSGDNFDNVFESTPKRKNSELEILLSKPLCRNNFQPDTSKQGPYAVFSPSSSVLLSVGETSSDCRTVQYLHNKTTKYLERSEDTRIITTGDFACQDAVEIHQNKSKRSNKWMEHKSGNDWMYDIIEEVLIRAFAQLEKLMSEKITIENSKVLSLADVIPKTPGKHRFKDSNQFKNRRSISGAKRRSRLSFGQSSFFTLKENDLPFNLDSAKKADIAKQVTESTSDGGIFKHASLNEGDKHYTDCYEFMEQRKESLDEIVCNSCSELAFKCHCLNLNLDLVHEGGTKSKERSRGTKQFSEIHKKESILVDTDNIDFQNTVETDVIKCKGKPREGERNSEIGNDALNSSGKQYSIDEVLEEKSILADKIILYNDSDHDLNIKRPTKIPSKGPDELMETVREKSENSACQIVDSTIIEPVQEDQVVDSKIYHLTALRSCETDNKTEDIEVIHISMDILDDLMFGRETSTTDPPTSAFMEEQDSLLDCYTLNEADEKAYAAEAVAGKVLADSQQAKITQSVSSFIGMDSPLIKQNEEGCQEEKLINSHVINVKDCEIRNSETRIKTSPAVFREASSIFSKCNLSEVVNSNGPKPKLPDFGDSVAVDDFESVAGMSIIDAENYDEDRQEDQVTSHQVDADGVCSDSGCNANLESIAVEERNANEISISFPQYARKNIHDVAKEENLLDVIDNNNDINLSISDSLLSFNNNFSECMRDNYAQEAEKGDSHPCQDGKSQFESSGVLGKKSLVPREFGAAAEEKKEESLNFDVNNEEAFSQLLNSSLDIDEFTQMLEEKKSASQSFLREPFESIEDWKMKQDSSLSNSQNLLSTCLRYSRLVNEGLQTSNANINVACSNLDSSNGLKDSYKATSSKYVPHADDPCFVDQSNIHIDMNTKLAEEHFEFFGFSTASGKKVNISEKALNAARKKLEAGDESVKEPEKHDAFTGFNTSSGKKVNISEKALDAARKKLEAGDESVKEPERQDTFTGFTTALGKKVNISEKALDSARKKLEAGDESVKEPERQDTFTGFTTALGKKVNISEKALDSARKKLEAGDESVKEPERQDTFTGFTTALGKKVNISEKALDSARKKLEAGDESVKEPERQDTFTGFTTGSGKKVNISEKALDAARKKLEAGDESVKEPERQDTFTGFTTASGKKVNISEKALNAARKKLESGDESGKEPEKHDAFTGFNTASGKKVNISEKALDAARKKLESGDESVKEPERQDTFRGFTTGSGRKVNISENALNATRKKLESGDVSVREPERHDSFRGFTTGSGRKVNISEKALDAARKKLEAGDESGKEPEKHDAFTGFNTASGKKVNISEKALNAARKKLEAVDESGKEPEKHDAFTGFNTASGKKVNISEKALNAARKKLEAGDESGKEPEKHDAFTGFNTASGKKVNISEKALNAARKKLEAGDESVKELEKHDAFTGFNTASGKKVNISEKALDAARKKLESGDESVEEAEKHDAFTGFNTASGKKVNISEKALDAARKKLESGDESVEEAEKHDAFTGFNTASGKKVNISEKALIAARKKYDSCDENVNEIDRHDSFRGINTALGRKVNILDKTLFIAGKKVETVDENVKEAEERIDAFSGVNTTSGRNVNIFVKGMGASETLNSDDGNPNEVVDVDVVSDVNSSLEHNSVSNCRQPEVNNLLDENGQNCICILNDSLDGIDDCVMETSGSLDKDGWKGVEKKSHVSEEGRRQHQKEQLHGNEKVSGCKHVAIAGDGILYESRNAVS